VSDYERVKEELAAGTLPQMICAICPWHRPCITPPEMSQATMTKLMDQAKQADLRADPQQEQFPMGQLLATVLTVNKDITATMCPVLVQRIQGPDGRQLADVIRNLMQNWQAES
jgi:hypothetical protein